MSIPENPFTASPSKPLRTWKEIADYLRVSVRTAQKWEADRALPVRRHKGIKSQVQAYPEELAAWQAAELTEPPLSAEGLDAAEDTGASPPMLASAAGTGAVSVAPANRWRASSSNRRAVVVAIVAALACAATVLWLRSRHTQIEDIAVRGSDLIVFGDEGKEIWRHTFPYLLRESHYSQLEKSEYSWRGDLYGDGDTDLLFIAKPFNEPTVGSSVFCFGPGGRVKWEFVPGRTVKDSVRVMYAPYYVTDMLVIAGRSPADTRIVVSGIHYIEQPCQVAFLDSSGRVQGEYWHPGHLGHLAQADLDGNGRNLLLAAGVNNGNHQATMVVLDPWKVKGLMTPTEMRDQVYRLLDMPQAHERSVVFFPRSCISLGERYTRVSDIRVTKHRLVITTSEGIGEKTSPGFVYELDYGLHVVEVQQTDNRVQQIHRRLEALGKVDHPYSSQDWDRLKANTVVLSKGPPNGR